MPRKSVHQSAQLDLFAEPPPRGGEVEPQAPTPLSNATPAPEPAKPPLDGSAEPVAEKAAEKRPVRKAALAPRPSRTGAPPKTLADLRGELEAMPETKRLVDIKSAIKRVGKVLDRKLEDIPTEPQQLGSLLAAATPMLAGMSNQRWGQVKSLLLAGLREVGIDLMPGRDAGGLSPAWRELAQGLPDQRCRSGLSRLLSFFSREGVEPEAVDALSFERFRMALKTQSLLSRPDPLYRTAVDQWNVAVKAAPGWPQVKAARVADTKSYTRSWAEFPESFRADVEGFLGLAANPDPLADDYSRPLEESTIDHRRRMLRQVASALVASGFDIDALTSLAVLAEIKNAKAALRYLLDRKVGETTPHIGNQAHVLVLVAERWLKTPEQAKALRKLLPGLRVKQKGMVEKNRKRLRQFAVEDNVDALLNLPRRVLEDVRRHDTGDVNQSIRLMRALAVELLTMTLLRIDNLAGLKLGEHVVDVRRGGKRTTHIAISEAETKTDVPFEMTLPDETAAMLKFYVDNHRHRICAAPSPYLFPAPDGQRRSTKGLSVAVKDFIRRETGLVMNPHLFRHFGGKIYLEEHPEDIETVRRTLGHTSTKTTLRAYAEIRNDHAIKRYDATIAQVRQRVDRINTSKHGRTS